MKISKEARNKVLISLLLITIGVLSLTKIGDFFTDPNLYKNTISILDSEKEFTFSLSAASSSASILIALIPTDATTPIANQFANLSGYLTIILAIIFFEKYLLTIIASLVFRYIVPFACVALIVCIYIPNEETNKIIKILIGKILVFSLVLMSVIPVSVSISNKIVETYKNSVNQTIVEIKNEESSNLFETIVSFTVEVKEKISNWLSNMMEYVAVMIVSSCLIPVATLFVFIWITNQIFGTHIPRPKLMFAGKKIGSKISGVSKDLNNIIDSNNTNNMLKEKE